MLGIPGSSPHTRGALSVGSTIYNAYWDHPRIRGEHNQRHPLPYADPGIIPAYAGSTHLRGSIQRPPMGSSPHTRGALAALGALPSSVLDHPRIRGEHHPREGAGLAGARIIPAYAGSTRALQAQVAYHRGSSPHTRGALIRSNLKKHSRQDHPRIRGEHNLKRVRVNGETGIIPAYAGSTITIPSRIERWRGSSPHTRGARTRC